MTLSFLWRAEAGADLLAIIGYIADRNLPAAERLQAAIEHMAERLPDHPFIHSQGRVAGTLKAVVHPNYMIVHRVDAAI